MAFARKLLGSTSRESSCITSQENIQPALIMKISHKRSGIFGLAQHGSPIRPFAD
jgi:hypothetical protein